MAVGYSVCGLLGDTNITGGYGRGDEVIATRTVAKLGTAEDCLPMMEGGELAAGEPAAVISPLDYETENVVNLPDRWETTVLTANEGTNLTDRLSPPGSWYDITVYDNTSGAKLAGPFRVRIDADTTYSGVVTYGCIGIDQLIAAGATL